MDVTEDETFTITHRGLFWCNLYQVYYSQGELQEVQADFLPELFNHYEVVTWQRRKAYPEEFLLGVLVEYPFQPSEEQLFLMPDVEMYSGYEIVTANLPVTISSSPYSITEFGLGIYCCRGLFFLLPSWRYPSHIVIWT